MVGDLSKFDLKQGESQHNSKQSFNGQIHEYRMIVFIFKAKKDCIHVREALESFKVSLLNWSFFMQRYYILKREEWVFLYDQKRAMRRSFVEIEIGIFTEFFILILQRKNIMEMEKDMVSRVIKSEKMFNFHSGHCSYSNTEACRKNRPSGQDPQIEIKNNVCSKQNSKLVKVTEVTFKEVHFFIEDTYEFFSQLKPGGQYSLLANGVSSAPTASSDGSQHAQSNNGHKGSERERRSSRKKKLIFKKKVAESGNSQSAKNEERNTKNIAKNFCKAFVKHLKEKSDQGDVLKKTKQLIEEYQLNNQTIHAMISSPSVCTIFETFLKEEAENWIRNSKIHDKEIHLEAIRLYMKMITKKQVINLQGDSSSEFQSLELIKNGKGEVEEEEEEESEEDGEQISESLSQSSVKIFESADVEQEQDKKEGERGRQK